jgi:hypothetical protein
MSLNLAPGTPDGKFKAVIVADITITDGVIAIEPANSNGQGYIVGATQSPKTGEWFFHLQDGNPATRPVS